MLLSTGHIFSLTFYTYQYWVSNIIGCFWTLNLNHKILSVTIRTSDDMWISTGRRIYYLSEVWPALSPSGTIKEYVPVILGEWKWWGPLVINSGISEGMDLRSFKKTDASTTKMIQIWWIYLYYIRISL